MLKQTMLIQDLEGNLLFFQIFEYYKDSSDLYEFYFLVDDSVYAIWWSERSKSRQYLAFEKENSFPTADVFLCNTEYEVHLTQSIKSFIHDLVGDIYINICDNEEIWVNHVSQFFTCLGITHEKED